MGVKAYNLYNRSVYPVQSVNKQDGRQVGKQKASRVVMGAVGAFCEIQCVDGSSRVCQFRRISARILDDRINTLRRDLNSKRLYDRYRSEHSRNEIVGWCNTGSNHLLRYSRKHDENKEQGRMVPMQSPQISETGLQPITAKVGARVRIAECAG